jgi:hypothetical protein
MLALKWYDKREVTMLSTIHQLHMGFTGKNNPKTKTPIQKPISIIDYNSKRGAIGKVCIQISFAEFVRKPLKWYRKLFFICLIYQSSIHICFTKRKPGRDLNW